MIQIIFSIILLLALSFSILVLITKRKRSGITGIKSALTSICFYLVAIINLLAYWFDFMGLLSWSITVILLILGAYFTKHIPIYVK